MEFWLLILIAVLEVVDGQGLALRILRVLSSLIGGNIDGDKDKQNQTDKA